jgi:hypothetical protein
MVGRRSVKRIPINRKIRYSFGNEIHSGTITNISAHGMFVRTGTFFPLKAEFNIYIKSREKIITVQAKVNRLLKTGDKYDGMGVELLNPPEQYHELLRVVGWSKVKDSTTDKIISKKNISKESNHIPLQ